MMEATVAAIFIVCFASNGGPVKSNVPEQEKFHNLFNSVAKHNQVEFNINRERLREQAIHERQAFDSLKDALRITPRRRTANHENPERHQRDVPLPNSNPAAPELTAEKEKQVTITSAERQTDLTSPSPKFSEETTQRLPEQNASWRTIRSNNYVYVDKTPYLVKLLERGGELWYVTRPRRFGKSSFLDMAADYFRGEEDLFRGLAVEDIGNTKFLAKFIRPKPVDLPKWKEFPVIHLNFGQFDFKTEEEFSTKYNDRLKGIARWYNLNTAAWSSFDLYCLIIDLHVKFNRLPVIILVDEYDHPFQHALVEVNKEVAKAVRTKLHGMFTTIKNNVCYLGLALLTGVSKLSLPAIESTGMNAFVDLTYDEELAQAFGLSETEINSRLGPNLRHWAKHTEKKAGRKPSGDPVKRIMEDLVYWYDGYQFALVEESCKVFNPVSTIQSVKKEKCASYWSSTGSLKYLVSRFYEEEESWDVVKKGVSVSEDELFLKVDPLSSPPPLYIIMLLFGYYTISHYDKESGLTTLKCPNKEITDSLEFNLAMYLPEEGKFVHEDHHFEVKILKRSLLTGRIDKAMEVLKRFAFQPYEDPLNTANVDEATRRLALLLRAAGIETEVSIKFSKDDDPKKHGGDIDVRTIDLPINYIFEVKCTTKTDGTALPGIKQQLGYLRHHPKNFFKANRNLSNYRIVAVNFLLQHGSISVNSWITLPCVNGIVQYSEVVADPENLKKELHGIIKWPEYRILKCGPGLPLLTYSPDLPVDQEKRI